MNREKKKKGNVPEMPSIRSPSKVRELHEEQSTSTSGQGLEDCGSVEFKLVEALRRKEVEWQAWPKSFRASADAYSRYSYCSLITELEPQHVNINIHDYNSILLLDGIAGVVTRFVQQWSAFRRPSKGYQKE